MFEKIMERLEILDALEQSNTELISKVDAIQAKLEEMARGQLISIIEQGERFMKELLSAKSAVEAHIHYEALQDTVKIGKEELKEMLKDAFGDNEEVKQLVREKFRELDKGLHAINDNIVNTNSNVLKTIDGIDSGFRTVLQNELTHFATLKNLVTSTDKTVTEMNYTVSKIPTDKGLY